MLELGKEGGLYQDETSVHASGTKIITERIIKSIKKYNLVHQLITTDTRRLCRLCCSKTPSIKHKVNSKCKQCNVFLCRKHCFEIHLNKGL